MEGLLYYFGESIDKEKIKTLLDIPEEEFNLAVGSLRNELIGRGISLVETEKTLGLYTAPEMTEIIEKIKKEERSKELTKATLETLSLIAYSDGVARSDIDFIRGVNSAFILKTLSLRGFIEKIPHPQDARKYIYKATTDLYAFLGVTRKEELPDWQEFNEKIIQKKQEVVENQ